MQRLGYVSPSGPRARSSRHGTACTAPASSPRPRTVSGHRGAARHGRLPSPARGALPPGTARTADGARGTQPAPGASGDRSSGARHSGAAGPPVASRPPRSSPPADSARAASRATATPQSKTRHGTAGRASRDSYRLCSNRLHLAVNDINPARGGGAVSRSALPECRGQRPGCPAHGPVAAVGHSSAVAKPNLEGCARLRPHATRKSPPG
jgi:hypothetical protein